MGTTGRIRLAGAAVLSTVASSTWIIKMTGPGRYELELAVINKLACESLL